MDTPHYLDIFQKAANNLAGKHLNQQTVKVGIWLNSVALKIQQPAWVNQTAGARPFSEGIFFSIWVNDDTISKGSIFYNVHALKLRELSAYKIQSRKFADAFRMQFKPLEKQWPNVSTNFGPLTLMEGWVELPEHHAIEKAISNLASQFSALIPIIDNLLNETKK